MPPARAKLSDCTGRPSSSRPAGRLSSSRCTGASARGGATSLNLSLSCVEFTVHAKTSALSSMCEARSAAVTRTCRAYLSHMQPRRVDGGRTLFPSRVQSLNPMKFMRLDGPPCPRGSQQSAVRFVQAVCSQSESPEYRKYADDHSCRLDDAVQLRTGPRERCAKEGGRWLRSIASGRRCPCGRARMSIRRGIV